MGKSTLCKLLSEKYSKGFFVYEETENPHLQPFYDHMATHPNQYNPHAFNSQTYFLQKRFENEMKGQNKIWVNLEFDKENFNTQNQNLMYLFAFILFVLEFFYLDLWNIRFKN